VSRTLSAAARQSMFGSETDQVWLLLLTINHQSLSEPIRVVRNFTQITSRGNIYIAMAFDIELPGDDPDNLSQVRLRIDNVDRSIVEAIRQMDSPATCEIEVVLASSPDTVEVGPFSLTLGDVSYDQHVVEGTFKFEDILNESFPKDTFVPAKFQGLF
jgi:hypothetical protein